MVGDGMAEANDDEVINIFPLQRINIVAIKLIISRSDAPA
jgi:ribosomal protein S3AE